MSKTKLVNLNSADVEELAELPGVGIVLSWRIVETREAHAQFGTIEDLKKVPGLGAVAIDRLRPLVVC